MKGENIFRLNELHFFKEIIVILLRQFEHEMGWDSLHIILYQHEGVHL